MNRKALLILFFIPSILVFGQTMIKRTLTSGGQVGEGFHGFATGQAAQGNAHSSAADSAAYGYWTFQGDFEICIELVTDSIWNVTDAMGRDTIDLHYTANMHERDYFSFYNCGNCAVDLGARVASTSPSTITTGYYSSLNRATVRAQFREDEICPVTYNATFDWIKDITTWATDYIFGPSGDNLEAGKVIKLWTQILTPTDTDDSGEFIDEFSIIVEIQSRIFLP